MKILLALLLLTVPALAKPVPAIRCAGPAPAAKAADQPEAAATSLQPDAVWTEGSVAVAGTKIDYCAVAGTLIVHQAGWDDTGLDTAPAGKDAADAAKPPAVHASMFYTAYFRREAATPPRPVTFLFNGGPGSATIWLHMGAFGPKRVETKDARHLAAAPYRLVNNDQSLLDVSDLVFVDAPGTGFGRVVGPDGSAAFHGIDEDAHAFADFIAQFLSKYRRWNAPKYVFGESYGTTRAAVLANLLQTDPGIDLNGVIMLSQVLSGDFFPDQPSATPGNDLPYILGLPTYAATAWYHAQPGHAVPPDRLAEVERFAMGPYAGALAAGSALDPGERDAIVEKLRDYTGLPAEYLRNANLRVAADAFRQALLRDRGLIVGGADTRYTGQTLDRMGRKAAYDPTDAGVTSAYVSSFNDYVRRELKYGEGKTYRVAVDDIGDKWNFRREPDGNGQERTANVLPDLAHAMKLNPLLKVQLNSGVFDLLTPYFQGHYEMRHLPVPAEIQANIEYRCFRSGHMVYLAPEERARLHDSVADFIERTSGAAGSKRPASPVCP